MDRPNTDSAAVKMEPGTGDEGGGEMPDTNIDIDLPDVKKECFEYSMRIDQTGKKIYSKTMLFF